MAWIARGILKNTNESQTEAQMLVSDTNPVGRISYHISLNNNSKTTFQVWVSLFVWNPVKEHQMLFIIADNFI